MDADDQFDPEDFGLRRRKVVLVGITGDGKSTTGNALCDRPDAFAVGAGFSSVTQENAHADYMYSGEFWRVIDTIGLHDTGLAPEEVFARFSTFADRALDGIDAFLFVVRWGRFKPEHAAAFEAFEANCGAAALERTVLVFTACPETDEALQAALAQHAPGALKDVLRRLGGGVVGVDHGATAFGTAPREVLHDALRKLLLSKDAAEAPLYTHEALAEAKRQKEEREAQQSRDFQSALAAWRAQGSGPVVIEREEGVVTRPAGAWREVGEEAPETPAPVAAQSPST